MGALDSTDLGPRVTEALVTLLAAMRRVQYLVQYVA